MKKYCRLRPEDSSQFPGQPRRKSFLLFQDFSDKHHWKMHQQCVRRIELQAVLSLCNKLGHNIKILKVDFSFGILKVAATLKNKN